MAAYTTVDDAGSFFNPVLYSTTGSSLAVTGAGFQPDLTWIKLRTSAQVHNLTDAVRGATKYLQSNDSAATVTNAESLKTFDSDGFTVGTDDIVNKSGNTAVSWNWKMGTTSGLSGGTLTPDGYSYNATSGQGVYEYTGGGSAGTISHGLGAVPKLMMVKRSENDAQEWRVYFSALGPTKNLVLSEYDAENTTSINWNDTAPTSSVFTVGSSLTESAKVMMGYIFADVQGYSRFGSYTGNGNVDGPYVYTGFKPALVLIKNATGSSMSWTLRGDALNPFNPADGHVVPNTTAAEASGKDIDILSNGFKARTTDGGVNGSGNTLVYGAWAESPFVNSSSVPNNAR